MGIINCFFVLYNSVIEYSENLVTKLTGVPAVAQRVKYRLSVRRGEIPYFSGGLEVREFAYGNDLASSVRKVLSDFNAEVNVSGGRVSVGDVVIAIPGV